VKRICDYLVPAKIHHICHEPSSEFCHHNPFSVSDLCLAMEVCTECLVRNGTIGMKELLDGSFNAMNFDAIDQRSEPFRQRTRNVMKLRSCYEMLPKHTFVKPDYADCHLRSGAGPVREDRICVICNKNVDE